MPDPISSVSHFPSLLQCTLEVFRLPSPSGREALMRAYVVEHLRTWGCTVSVDATGNVLAYRGAPAEGQGYPLLSFHLDCIWVDPAPLEAPLSWESESTRRRRTRRSIPSLEPLPLEALILEDGWLHSNGRFVLGGDDKCGAVIALTLAQMTDLPLKIVASVEEERGCVGIAQVDPAFFADVAYALVLDRRGANHLIVSIADHLLCQGSFAAALMRAAADTGLLVYAAQGALSDALTLSDAVPNVANLSVGYYHPHTVHERVSLRDLWHAYRWVHAALHCLPCSRAETALPSEQKAPDPSCCARCHHLRLDPALVPGDLHPLLCH
ncbi:MAG TPA: hypothetical protein VHD63_05430, partial [Ktedonobacteraceae bacterium]|nr:hypothetical protein [Ktedonobacteraceae bacterium]